MINPIPLIKKWFETSSKKQKLTTALLILSLTATVTLLISNGSSETASDPLGSTPLYFAGAFVKLIGVLLLIVASSIVFQRWLRFGPQGKAVRQMRLLETVRLSPKQALHLVSIGDQHLLIGATDQNVALITHVESTLDDLVVEPAHSQPGIDFGSLLQSFNGRMPNQPFQGKGKISSDE